MILAASSQLVPSSGTSLLAPRKRGFSRGVRHTPKRRAHHQGSRFESRPTAVYACTNRCLVPNASVTDLSAAFVSPAPDARICCECTGVTASGRDLAEADRCMGESWSRPFGASVLRRTRPISECAEPVSSPALGGALGTQRARVNGAGGESGESRSAFHRCGNRLRRTCCSDAQLTKSVIAPA